MTPPVQIDLMRIKREARTRRKQDASLTYMQHLDQVARRLYGVRHYYEARVLKQQTLPKQAGDKTRPASGLLVATPAQHYLRDIQVYYLDI